MILYVRRNIFHILLCTFVSFLAGRHLELLILMWQHWKMVTFFEADFSDLEFLMFLFIFCNRWRTSALKVQGGHSHAAVNITERERARAWVDEFQNKNIKENFVILSRFLHRNLSNLWHLQVNYLVKVTTKFHSTSSFIQEACNIITLGKLK